jgi:hypothetical protein
VTPVPASLRTRWRSGDHVGVAKPTQVVEVQKGAITRDYGTFQLLDGSRPSFGTIVGSEHNARPWQAKWVADGPWIEVPNVAHVNIAAQFADDGMADPATATIDIDNVIFQQLAGVAGIYHMIRRGYLSPFYGFTISGRARNIQATQNEWFDVLNGGCLIRVKQGYGDSLATEFIGLIDDNDIKSDPDTITLTCRSTGALFTDQRVFGWNKAAEILPPVIFADRLHSDDVTKEGANAQASSVSESRFSARNVLTTDHDTFWESQGHSAPDVTEWVEIRVPRGRYESIYALPSTAGCDVYFAIYARDAKVDGEAIADGWVSRGLGVVPGDNGGFPYCKRVRSMDAEGQSVELGFVLETGDNTVIRMCLRNLGYNVQHRDYRARVSRLVGFKRKLKAAAKNEHWILTDDASDVLKWVFMWCGFHEWKVDKLGVRLKDPMAFHQADYMADIIKQMVAQANYVFYMDKPTDRPGSIGVPTFVKSRALSPPAGGQEEVRDTDLLTGVETKFSKENLAYIIRARGQMLSKAKGGISLGEEATTRVTAAYRPPWAGTHFNVATGALDQNYPFTGRLAGVHKHVTHYDENISTEDEAMMACVLIAIQEAVSSYQGTIEVPGYPGFGLNEHISVVDTPSGTNMRMWLASVSSDFTSGADATYTTTLAGALIDTPDILGLAIDYLTLLGKILDENPV